jgi:nitrate/TMAO reductase-like tetraheme cytochrome c subunit
VRKALVVALLAFCMAGTAAWASDALLGPHDIGNNGCLSCHAPHNALPGSSLYLWGQAVPTGAYKTYLTSDGQGGAAGIPAATVPTWIPGSTSGNFTPDTSVHTILCLSCHDASFASATMNTNTAVALTSSPTVAGMNGQVVTTAGDLSTNHPVHVTYPNNTDPTYWGITVTTTGVTFTDTTSTFATGYGHSARLYPNAGGTAAYIECSTCHNPHNFNQTVATVGGVPKGVTTNHFIRGAYDTTSGTKTNFCMSCHSYATAAFNGNMQ